MVDRIPTEAVLAAAQTTHARLAEGATVAVRYQTTLHIRGLGQFCYVDWPAGRTATTDRIGAGAGTA